MAHYQQGGGRTPCFDAIWPNLPALDNAREFDSTHFGGPGVTDYEKWHSKPLAVRNQHIAFVLGCLPRDGATDPFMNRTAYHVTAIRYAVGVRRVGPPHFETGLSWKNFLQVLQGKEDLIIEHSPHPDNVALLWLTRLYPLCPRPMPPRDAMRGCKTSSEGATIWANLLRVTVHYQNWGSPDKPNEAYFRVPGFQDTVGKAIPQEVTGGLEYTWAGWYERVHDMVSGKFYHAAPRYPLWVRHQQHTLPTSERGIDAALAGELTYDRVIGKEKSLPHPAPSQTPTPRLPAFQPITARFATFTMSRESDAGFSPPVRFVINGLSGTDWSCHAYSTATGLELLVTRGPIPARLVATLRLTDASFASIIDALLLLPGARSASTL